jgi:hypothetical protein
LKGLASDEVQIRSDKHPGVLRFSFKGFPYLGIWAAKEADFSVENGQTNPFLHLSMHVSVSEQCSIDQPRGIRQAVELLAAKRNSLHDAHHEVMECLGAMLWESQRSGRPPDGQAYIAAVQRLATRD